MENTDDTKLPMCFLCGAENVMDGTQFPFTNAAREALARMHGRAWMEKATTMYVKCGTCGDLSLEQQQELARQAAEGIFHVVVERKAKARSYDISGSSH